jgi:hypothetical protein
MYLEHASTEQPRAELLFLPGNWEKPIVLSHSLWSIILNKLTILTKANFWEYQNKVLRFYYLHLLFLLFLSNLAINYSFLSFVPKTHSTLSALSVTKLEQRSKPQWRTKERYIRTSSNHQIQHCCRRILDMLRFLLIWLGEKGSYTVYYHSFRPYCGSA